MTALGTWWNGLSPRERGLLTVLSAVAAFVFLWVAVVTPALAYRSAAIADYRDAVLDRADIEALTAGPSAAGDDPRAVVEATFAEAGLAPVIRSADGGLAVSLPAVRTDVLFNALARLEEAGVSVTTADIQANPDNTLAASLTLGGTR